MPINIDSSLDIDWNKELLINKTAYLNYKEGYIKNSNTDDEIIWETVSKNIKGI